MANDNQLQIDIVISPEKAKAQMVAAMGEITRTADEIFAKSESRKASMRKPTIDALYNEVKGIDAVSQAMSRQDQLAKALGIRSQTEATKRLALLEEFRQGLDRNSAGYIAAMQKIDTQQNLITHGNARARGEFHKMTAAMASLTFEVTGAIWGFTALGTAIAGPAAFGVRFMKQIEDAKAGIAGILVSMTTFSGHATGFEEAWKGAGIYIKKIQEDAMRFGVDFAKLVDVNRAALSKGLGADLSLSQVRTISTAGAAAVGMLGLDSRQYVQEVRDLFGGIQSASSTLATALGLTDKIVKDWRNKLNPDEFMAKMMERLGGFVVVAEKLQGKTLTGAWDMLLGRIRMLMSSEVGFEALKNKLMEVVNYIGIVDKKTGQLTLNPQLVKQVEAYWKQLMQIMDVLGQIGQLIAKLVPYIDDMVKGMVLIAAVNMYKWAMDAAIGIMAVSTAANTATGNLKLMLAQVNKAKIPFVLQIVVADIAFEFGSAIGDKLYQWFPDAIGNSLEKINKFIYHFGESIPATILDGLAAAVKAVGNVLSVGVTPIYNLVFKPWEDALSKAADKFRENAEIAANAENTPKRLFGSLLLGAKGTLGETGEEFLARFKAKAGLADKSGAGAGAGAAHQSVMEQVKLEMEAKVNASEKELNNVEKVDLAWQKLAAEKLKDLKLSEQRFEGSQYALAREAAHAADVREAHEKIISTLQKETEHYAKLGKKEPTQIETIQADIKVREERLKKLRDEIELRKQLETAPTSAYKSMTLGRIEEGMLLADLQKSKLTIPGAVRGATGAETMTSATPSYEELKTRSEKQFNFFPTEKLIEQADYLDKNITSKKIASANVIGLETQKIEEETANIGLTRSQKIALEIGKVEKDIKAATELGAYQAKEAYEDKLKALRKKYLKEEVETFSANFQNVFTDALQPGVNFMQKLGESFVSAMRQAVTKMISDKLFESMLKPATDAFMKSLQGEAGGISSLFSPTAGGMGLGGGALLPQLGLAIGVGSLLKSAFGHGPTQYEDSRLVGTVGGTGFQGRREQSWTEKGGFLTSDNRGTIISAVLMPEIRKLNDTINNLKVTFGNFGSAVGIWGLGIKDFEFAINAAGDTTNAIADGIGNALVPALKMFQIAGENLADTAKRLTNIFSATTDFIVGLGLSSVEAFNSIGIASANARKALTDAAGGADVFASLYSTFSSSILTDADRLKIALNKVGSTFAELGVHGVDTKEKFAALVKAETDAGHWDIVTKLLSVSDAFGQVVDSADKARKASEDLAKTHYKSALDAVDVLRKFAADTRDFMKSLWGGAQAPSQLSSGARRGEFLNIAQLAGAGDVKAQGQLQSSATGLLDFAKTQARTSLDYARSFAFVQTALDTTASTIENTVSAYDALLAEVVKANPYLADIAANTSDTKNNIVELAIVTATLLQETMTGKPISQDMSNALTKVEEATKGTLDTLMSSDLKLTDIIGGLGKIVEAIQSISLGGAGGVTTSIAGQQIEAVTGGRTVESTANTAVTEAYTKWQSAEAAVIKLKEWRAGLSDAMAQWLGVDYMDNYNKNLSDLQTKADEQKMAYEALVPKFAAGGTHMGGYRIVGENGPELEYTGPSHITSNADTRSLFNIEPMVNEIKELRSELRALGIPLVQNTRDTAKILTRWEGDGTPETRIVTA